MPLFAVGKHSLKDKYRKELSEKTTPMERKAEGYLRQLGISHRSQVGISNGPSFYIMDFHLPKPYRINLEIDGGYHRRQVAYDRKRDHFMTMMRRRVVRITNEEMEKMSLNEFNIVLEKARQTPIVTTREMHCYKQLLKSN